VHVVGKGYRKRDIPLHPDIRRTLREWLAARPATASQLLFPGRSGPLDRTTIERLLAKYARFAGDLPHVTPHILRHNASSRIMPTRVRYRADPLVMPPLGSELRLANAA
jgi:site-specific recombinase XerC